MRWWRERCLVLPPDVLVTLMRDARIKVHAFDLQGSYTVTLEGEAARAFPHELDHLNGVLIIDHAVDDDDLTSQAACPHLRLYLWAPGMASYGILENG
jgi:peptide deformylase